MVFANPKNGYVTEKGNSKREKKTCCDLRDVLGSYGNLL